MSGIDPFVAAAGTAPARGGREALFRQLALLGVAHALALGRRSGSGLAACLLGLDDPEGAARAIAAPTTEDPWTSWWAVMALGQAGDVSAMARALIAALAVPDPGPDGREVARRLEDLANELAALGAAPEGVGTADEARFAVDGHRVRPKRRLLVAGRSSAIFLTDPTWEALRLVRLAPALGTWAGNRSHLTLQEVVEHARRGDAGAGRSVPDDVPAGFGPQELLEALREDPAVRDRRLISLANEVREEREHLAGERARLEDERAEVRAELERLRRARPLRAAPAPLAAPRTVEEAADILGVRADAERKEIDRAFRRLVAGCHPDRVDGLHPSIRERASDLTVALTAARELLLGVSGRARAARG